MNNKIKKKEDLQKYIGKLKEHKQSNDFYLFYNEIASFVTNNLLSKEIESKSDIELLNSLLASVADTSRDGGMLSSTKSEFIFSLALKILKTQTDENLRASVVFDLGKTTPTIEIINKLFELANDSSEQKYVRDEAYMSLSRILERFIKICDALANSKIRIAETTDILDKSGIELLEMRAKQIKEQFDFIK